MKKGFFGLIGVLLAFSFVFMGCPTDSKDGDNDKVELSGTWKGGMANQTLSFQGNEFEVKKSDNSAYNQGTYSATENEITFTVVSGEHANGNCKVSYTKTETTLTLTYISGSGFDGLGIAGDYAKEEDETTKFEGTYKNPFGSQVTYTFTGNNWSRTNNNNNQIATGTFTFTDTTITFTQPDGNNTWTQGYTLTDTTLTLANEGGAWFYGEFAKQP